MSANAEPVSAEESEGLFAALRATLE